MHSQVAYTSNEYNYTQTLANNLLKLFKTDNNKISLMFFCFIYITLFEMSRSRL